MVGPFPFDGDALTGTPGAAGNRLAHIRHELRTPLNAIIGYGGMLAEEAEDDGLPATTIGDLRGIEGAGRELLRHVATWTGEELQGPQTSLEHRLQSLSAASADELQLVSTLCDRVMGASADESLAHLMPDLQRISSAATAFGLLVLQFSAGDGQAVELGAAETSATLDSLVQPLKSDLTGSILVVDDSESNLDLLSRRLTRDGHRVTTASSGVAALEEMKRQVFDVVMLDLLMPGLSGYDVLTRIRADDSLRPTSVIMLSALDDTTAIVRCIAAGAEDYLPKPVNPVLLTARLNAALEKKQLRDKELLYLRRLREEKQRSDDLLHVIFPDGALAELKATGTVAPKRVENVAVLFADVVGFTEFCDGNDPKAVIEPLAALVTAYETVVARHGLVKIKTVGDAFMAAAGLFGGDATPCRSAVACALEMIEVAAGLESGWQVRIGIQVGTVVAGVVGRRQYMFDLWGDTVNTAARLEGLGQPGAVNVSREVWDHLGEHAVGTSRGEQLVKGKGLMEMFLVTSVSADCTDGPAPEGARPDPTP